MLFISNKGLVEAGALTLLGASVKDGEAIGKFGSGFKYAIATFIREGYALRVWSGLDEIEITTKPEVFRDKTFQVIYVGGERTSITTNTGVEWKVRDAIREIWSNAIDEGGALRGIGDMNLLEGHTTIGIELKGEVEDMVEAWDKYFVHGVSEIHENAFGRIISQSLPNFYRRGIWICEDRERCGLFSYDFKDIDLPESRKIKTHSTSYATYEVLAQCTELEVFNVILDSIAQESMERYVFGYWGIGHGNGRRALHEAFAKRWDFFGNKRNHAKISGQTIGKRVLWGDDSVCTALAKCGFDRIEDNLEYNERYSILDWPIGYKDKVMPSVNRLAAVGVDLSKFKLLFAKFDESKFSEVPIAMADTKIKACVLSERAFESHPDMLMKALVEEWTHLEHNAVDCTVGQQHVYLDLIVNLIERIK